MAKLAFAQTVATLPLNTHPPPKTDTPLRNAPGEDGFCLGIPFGRDGNSLDFLKNLCQRAPYYSIQGATSRKKHISGEGRGKTPVLSEVFSSLVPLRISPSESAPERRYVSSGVSPAFLRRFSSISPAFLLLLPASGSSAGESESVLGYGQSYFVGFDGSAEFRYDFYAHHIGKNGRGKAGGVGVDEEEKGIFG